MYIYQDDNENEFISLKAEVILITFLCPLTDHQNS